MNAGVAKKGFLSATLQVLAARGGRGEAQGRAVERALVALNPMVEALAQPRGRGHKTLHAGVPIHLAAAPPVPDLHLAVPIRAVRNSTLCASASPALDRASCINDGLPTFFDHAEALSKRQP